jgi:hypothetical protein
VISFGNRRPRETNNVTLPAFHGEHGIASTVDVIIKGRDSALRRTLHELAAAVADRMSWRGR